MESATDVGQLARENVKGAAHSGQNKSESTLPVPNARSLVPPFQRYRQ